MMDTFISVYSIRFCMSVGHSLSSQPAQIRSDSSVVLEEGGKLFDLGFFCGNGEVVINKLRVEAGKGFLERVSDSGIENEVKQVIFS